MQFIRKISNYLLLAGVVVLISLMFPDQGRFDYQYNLGQTWKYEDLYAPMDFAIKKPASEVRALEEQVKNNFRPYYLHDLSVKEETLDQFRVKFEEEKNRMATLSGAQRPVDILERPERYEQLSLEYLTNIIDQPVLESIPEVAEIIVIRNNIQHIVSTGELTTVDDARNQLISEMRGALPDIHLVTPLVSGLVNANTFYQDSLSARLLQMELNNISRHRGMVQRGDLIVMNGSIVTEEIYARLQSYEVRFKEDMEAFRNRYVVFGGFSLLALFTVFLFGAFLRRYDTDTFSNFKDVLFISIWLVAFSYFTYLLEHYDLLSVYMIPFCIAPIVLKNFFSRTTAFLSFLAVILLSSYITSEGYIFTIMHIIAGLVALFTSLQTRYWSGFFFSIAYILATYITLFTAFSMFEAGSLTGIDYQVYGWLGFGAFLTLMAYPLIPLSERIFGYLSDITLSELADLDKPLLKKLSIRAPGTFQHTLQVANLAEAAAKKIGINALLIKVGALYHDIGKMKNPYHFIENQPEDNPHLKISAEESANIIIDHVTEGVKLARKEGLPQVVIDFILTHHGTTRVEYFFHKHKKDTDDVLSDKAFRYPGPRPRTKEEVVLMLADSLEASSKSLKNPSSDEIDELVDKIIRHKMNEEQFDRSSISFSDLATCKRVFKKMLKSIHHIRIEYPKEATEPITTLSHEKGD